MTFLFVSKNTLEYINKNLDYEIPILFPVAISTERFNSSKSKDINLITVGSLVQKNGHEFLIDIIHALKKITKRTINLKIIVEGILKESLQNKIIKLGLQENIQLLGKVDHPEQHLQSSNLYVHGASYEPFILVLIEAMAAGLPIISTDGLGNRDLIVNEYLVANRNYCEFAEYILQIYNTQKKHQKLSQNVRKFSKKYDIKPYVDELIKLYQASI